MALACAGGSDRLTDPLDRIGRLDPSMQSTVRHQPSQFPVQGALGTEFALRNHLTNQKPFSARSRKIK